MFNPVPLILLVYRLIKWTKDRSSRQVEQQERDRLAREIAERAEQCLIADILSGVEVPPFGLYLRPFVLERVIRERSEISWLQALLLPHTVLLNLLFNQKMSFDLILQNYLKPLGISLISIGPTNDKEGAGHVVVTDSSWRDRFRQLAERATTIIVIPGSQDGILSEIRWLRVSGLLVNAIFFKPAGYPKSEWLKVQELYQKEEDIELPEYSTKQLSFRMYSSGRCHSLLIWSTVYRKSKKARGNAQMRATLLNRPDEL